MAKSITARVVDSIDSDEGQAPGAVEFRKHEAASEAGVAFRCPCGCGTEGYLPVRPKGASRTRKPEWEWDGNSEKPTLSPSVFNSGLPCKWHGWLRNGEWVSV